MSCQCMFSGVCDVDAGEDPEVNLGNGFSLVKPNEYLLSARDSYSMTGREVAEGVSVSRYLVYRHEPPVPRDTYEDIKAIFHCGLIALQVLKPLRTLGVVFYGLHTRGGGFCLQRVERRPPMEPGPWALRKAFDRGPLITVPSTIGRIRQIMRGPSAERRNAFILLQLGLEHFHPLLAGLLWVMGLEAVFNSADNHDFKRKLCDNLGPATEVLPGWKTVDEIAIHLYTLRNKLAHGVDLRKVASDPKYPVDFFEKHTLPNSSEERGQGRNCRSGPRTRHKPTGQEACPTAC
jgi:hypothetical protein